MTVGGAEEGALGAPRSRRIAGRAPLADARGFDALYRMTGRVAPKRP